MASNVNWSVRQWKINLLINREGIPLYYLFSKKISCFIYLFIWVNFCQMLYIYMQDSLFMTINFATLWIQEKWWFTETKIYSWKLMNLPHRKLQILWLTWSSDDWHWRHAYWKSCLNQSYFHQHRLQITSHGIHEGPSCSSCQSQSMNPAQVLQCASPLHHWLSRSSWMTLG